MTLGFPDDLKDRLSTLGYSACTGDIGTSYYFQRNVNLSPAPSTSGLPQDYKEQEIIIIDLNQPRISIDYADIPNVQPEVDSWWFSRKEGEINTSTLHGHFLRNDFDRILETGGIFIVFANTKQVNHFFFGHTFGYQRFDQKKDLSTHNWGFLRALEYLSIGDDHGASINLHQDLSKSDPLSKLLSAFIESSHFNCTLEPGHNPREAWKPLAVNKYGSTVAATLKVGKGTIFIFPEIKEKIPFIENLFSSVLPQYAPNLFPDHVNSSWSQEQAYELSSVVALRQKIDEVQQKAKTETDSLLVQIEKIREESSYIFDLVRETGQPLVIAVQKTLKTLGFSKVIDADEDLAKQGITRQNREDLQIHDSAPTLILEVKGISNFPSDDDALAVQKYVVLRMREWKHVNVKGLFIVNHQRHLPPLERDNSQPFRTDLVHAATEQDIGLLTTWDLHRLLRSAALNEWTHENVKDIFYQTGRIEIVPAHYQYIGKIERYIEGRNILGIKLEGELRIGDRIAFELPIIFKEEVCDTLQSENKNVESATSGLLIATLTGLTKLEARIGTRVFKVNPS